MGTVLTVWMMISDSAFEKVSTAAAACRLRGAMIAGFVAFTPASPAATSGRPATPVAAANTIAARAKLGRINEHMTATVLMLGLAASEAEVCLIAGRFKAAPARCES